MSKHRVVVLKIVAGRLSVSEAASVYGVSRRHVHRLLARYRAEGLAGLEPRARRPKSNPATISGAVRARIVELRRELTASGLDAGPATIGWHLEQEQIRPPAISTIRRVLHAAGLVTAQPRKRPKASYIRFQAELPNQCWQSDFTHWQLADGSGVEILNWLDDHSRAEGSHPGMLMRRSRCRRSAVREIPRASGLASRAQAPQAQKRPPEGGR